MQYASPSVVLFRTVVTLCRRGTIQAATPPSKYEGREGCLALGGRTALRSHGAWYRVNITVCRGRGAGVSCAALPCGFYPAENCGASKGGVNELGKLRSEAKRNEVILTF
jgi:hypothetical protein